MTSLESFAWESIPPNTAPGGLVFRLTAGGRVFLEHAVPEADGLVGIGPMAEDDAMMALALAHRFGESRLFVYDGDTGECLQTVVTDP